MGFMQRIQRFMYGRYGGDTLNLVILCASVVWSFAWRYTSLWPVGYLSYALMGWAIFRIFSRNLVKRRAENEWFLRRIRPVTDWFKRTFARLRDKQHRYYACPKCRQTCRVPRGRGRIQIACPKCGEKFVKNT